MLFRKIIPGPWCLFLPTDRQLGVNGFFGSKRTLMVLSAGTRLV
jgi:hypothetical protein